MKTSERLLRLGIGSVLVTTGALSAFEAFNSNFDADVARNCQELTGENYPAECPPQAELDAVTTKETGEAQFFAVAGGAGIVLGGILVLSSLTESEQPKPEPEAKN